MYLSLCVWYGKKKRGQYLINYILIFSQGTQLQGLRPTCKMHKKVCKTDIVWSYTGLQI